MARYEIRTVVQLDNDDNDVVAEGVDDEEIQQTIGPRDFAEFGELIDSDTTEDGEFARLVYERFDTEYDRSAEEYFPVIITTTVERMFA